nr:nucleotidyl transferase AbiEii/AbiGii toxin family protein [Rhizobium sp. BK068]
MKPVIAGALRDQSLLAAIRIEDDTLYLDYDAVSSGSGYVAPSVMLEFGARSTGEPASIRDVTCDASGQVNGVEFPKTSPRVMHAERTFWEKATAIHVFCLQERLRGESPSINAPQPSRASERRNTTPRRAFSADSSPSQEIPEPYHSETDMPHPLQETP